MSAEHASGGLKHRRRLMLVLALTSSFMFVEAVAGVLTGSLVLLADAGHMLTDVGGLSLALAAIWFAQRPATARKTFGYYRAEILAALVNSILLFGVSMFVLVEAVRRFNQPPDVASVPLIAVASVGLAVNLASASLLQTGAGESMNVRGAFLEVLGDVLGSVGAIATGVILLTTGWKYADPLFAAFVGLFILPRTWSLLKGALDVLFEGTPAHIDINAVRDAIRTQSGVEAVHDLHVWTVTSGFIALSGHVQVGDAVDRDALLVSLRRELQARFAIEHVTIQVENDRLSAELGQDCFPETSPWEGGRRSPKGAAT